MKQALIRSLVGAAALTMAAEAPAQVSPDGGIVTKRSAHSVQATLDKLENIVAQKGFTVFARIDHAAGAAKVGQGLRPTQTLIFGNPKVGTKLMDAKQSASLDLPIRVASWEDAEGAVWLAYNDPAWLTSRHGIGGAQAVVETMTGALGKLTDAATTAK
ncbi:MAG: DUF302 domain-containing protein [Gammaproteobacteria bacterium]